MITFHKNHVFSGVHMGIIYIVISGLCSSLAGAMLKLGANKKQYLSLIDYWPHVTAVGFYFVGFVFYFLALSKMTLTVAYPIMVSSAILFVMFMGAVWFSEPITLMKIFGASLIIAGVIVVNMA
ncbi:DMT family transporter [Erwinia sorbitola]|uniref:EamA family transporter n=1 Tax=Erwinia sorbitola TaxID=2681984 RepID=A0A6I6EAK2_9GAMM|nr:SMR family transporter [Erwinia sorbitola]MTD28777.1 EamA family transporter [Erwinia sorbitola]QGU86777.1 EamA family transporter [Erwinia sorbitola]